MNVLNHDHFSHGFFIFTAFFLLIWKCGLVGRKFSFSFEMTLVRYILFWVLLSLLSTGALATARCFEEIIEGPEKSCQRGPMKSRVSMRQVICAFKLECPEHNRAIEWQEVPAVNQALLNFSLLGASTEDLARWHILRAKQHLYSGQYSNAVVESGEAMAMLATEKDQVLLWYALYFKGIALKHSHAYDAAGKALGSALTIATHINDERYRLYVLHAISDLMEIEERHVLALEYYREFHRLHQLLNEKSVEVKEQRDSTLLASLALNAKAGVTAGQWKLFAGSLLLALLLTIYFFRSALLQWSYDGVKNVAVDGIKFGANKKAVFRLIYPKSEILTDEEILVDEAKVERLVALRNVRLLTQEDWEAFETIFSLIYPEFLIKLRYVHPEITQTEEKLSCLLRIHYGTKDVAKTLAISPQSVSVSRYRLRKRMGLPLKITLEEYIMSF